MSQVKILVIDGHPVYALKTVAFLEGIGLRNVTLAKTGQEGLTIAEYLKPDIIILSSMVSDMRSLDVCLKIKSKVSVDSKVIVQYGLFTPEIDISQYKEFGASYVLERKEKDLSSFTQAIETLILNPTN